MLAVYICQLNASDACDTEFLQTAKKEIFKIPKANGQRIEPERHFGEEGVRVLGGCEKTLHLTSNWGPRSEGRGPGLPCLTAGGQRTACDAGVYLPRWWETGLMSCCSEKPSGTIH